MSNLSYAPVITLDCLAAPGRVSEAKVRTGESILPRIAYVNGRYEALAVAGVSIEDRGFQFADGVYEVIAVLNGVQLDAAAHLARLDYSLDALAMDRPCTPAVLPILIAQVLRQNRVTEGLVYLQITRGAAPRDHFFPPAGTPSSLIITAKPYDFSKRAAQARDGAKVITVPDIRWSRCDIKSISLLPNVLAKEQAKRAGAIEAVFIDDQGMVTEGGSTNMWMVDKKGTLITKALGSEILPGIARHALLRAAKKAGFKIVERSFSKAELLNAREAFFTSTTAPCMPIVQVDGEAIGSGNVGDICHKLLDLTWREIKRQTGFVPA
jgi:D-alanine transaminase